MIRKQLYSVTFEKVSRGYAKFTSWRIIPYNSCFLLFLLRLCAPWDSTTEMWPSEQRVQWFDKITKPHLFATSLCQQNEVENKRTAWSMLRLWSTKLWNHQRMFSSSGVYLELPMPWIWSLQSPLRFPLSFRQMKSFILENNLTKEAYINLWLISKLHHSDIWPVYEDVLGPNETTSQRTFPSRRCQSLFLFQNMSNKMIGAFSLYLKQSWIFILMLQMSQSPTLKWNQKWASTVSLEWLCNSTENEDGSDSALLSTCLVPLQ